MCGEDDLKSIGLPLGPRKKILKYIAEREKKLQETPSVQQEPEDENSKSFQTAMPDLSRQPSW